MLRRRYYDLFSHFYDAFVALHSRGDERDTRKFLVDSARMEYVVKPDMLDVCCGTGSVILGFVKRYPNSVAAGVDFSRGMLRRAKKKDLENHVLFVQGDAARIPFADDAFDVVVCSHALYELKGTVRSNALKEMKRVVKPDPGSVFIVEHEQPKQPFIRLLFMIRLAHMPVFCIPRF